MPASWRPALGVIVETMSEIESNQDIIIAVFGNTGVGVQNLLHLLIDLFHSSTGDIFITIPI